MSNCSGYAHSVWVLVYDVNVSVGVELDEVVVVGRRCRPSWSAGSGSRVSHNNLDVVTAVRRRRRRIWVVTRGVGLDKE
jgi:hypothetical protein